jgi:ABC-type multidrug transport system ATPase subunit
MLRELTVRENIAFSARVRLPQYALRSPLSYNTRDWSSERIERLVDVVISSLNLTHVQNTEIGDESKRGISGGQRKRVNIGIELAAGPSVLFLDEPTSGLDSTQALQVANIMKQLAGIGMTVAAVIHQPRYEIFKQFDDLILLAPGGKVAYVGPIAEVEPYFSSLGFKVRKFINGTYSIVV